MSATTHGLTTLTFGVPTLTGYVIQSYDSSTKAANVVEVMDEQGNRVVSRYDDITTEITIDAKLAGASLPAPGSTVTYNTIVYEVLSIDKKGVNKDFTTVSIKGKVSAGISLP